MAVLTGNPAGHVTRGITLSDTAQTQWKRAEACILGMDRVLLYGPPGTGKTTSATLLGNPKKVYSVTLTEDTPMVELRGHFIPKGNEFVWLDGPGIAAFRNGGRLVLNEIDHASPDVLTLLHALLDDRRIARITLPNGETLTPHADYSVVATMNGEPADLPDALADRFLTLGILFPHPQAITSLPKDLRMVARRTTSLQGNRRVSLRSWMQYAELREILDSEEALTTVFGPAGEDIMDAMAIADAE